MTKNEDCRSISWRAGRRAGLHFALWLSFTSLAIAQTCLGPVTGIPANYTAPNWWQEPGGTGACESASPPVGCDYYQSLNDPRWVGAGDVSFGDGVENILEFRGLQDASYVYLSWRMNHATVGTTDNSLFYFAIQDPNPADTSTGTLVVGVNLKNNSQNADQPYGSWFQLQAWPAVAGGTAPLATLPAWLTSTIRVWTNAEDPNTGDNNSWAVQVQIPRTSLSISGSNFKMWFQSVTATLGDPTATLAWPTTAVITQSNFNNVYPDPSTWQSYQFSTGPSDPFCKTAGVSLALTSIGTYNNVPGTSTPDPQLILFQPPPPPTTTPPTNVFFAYPQNNSGNDIAAGAIQATFRIADWGSNPMDWEAGVDSSILWSDITGGSNVGNSGLIPNGTLANASNQNTFNWVVTGADLTAFQTGARRPDNCLLVELKGVGPQPIVFANNSIRRNMDFEQASTVSKKASITIKGLPSIAPDGRDVYVWVETLNMPAVAPKNGPPPQIVTTVPGHTVDVQRTSVSKGGNYVPPQPGKPIPLPGLAELERMLLAGEVTQAQIEAVVPTYIVHVYHENGTRLRLGGVDRPVLIEQGAFGYYASHTGALYGWQHDLVGEGFTLEKIATDFYRIKKMPNNGTVTVVTSFTAHEHRWNCFGLSFGTTLLFPLGGFLVIGLLLYRPRNKTREEGRVSP
jgi:hypothetical protein